MHRYERAFVQLTAKAAGLSEQEVQGLVRAPEPKLGDLSLPCFSLAKKLKKNPALIAGDIAREIEDSPLFEKIEAVGPYINATIDAAHLMPSVISEVRTLSSDFCRADSGSGQTVVIDYSSPNIAKPLGFHHLRSTMIGNALARIHRMLGYRVVGINFLGDWGKTFGLLAEAFHRFGDRKKIESGGIAYLLELYVQANKTIYRGRLGM